MLHGTVRTPEILLPPVWPLPRSLATTYGISVDFSSSPYLDVSVQAVPHITLCIHVMLTEYCSAGFPHSEICGSRDMCSSPQLIAACHVLHRLPVPRHSPCALCSLTFRIIWANSHFLKCSSIHFPLRVVCLQTSRSSLVNFATPRNPHSLIASAIRFVSRFFLLYLPRSYSSFVIRFSRFHGLTSSYPEHPSECSMSHTLPDVQQSTFFGGDERNRTAGLLLARQALSHLSYTPSSQSTSHRSQTTSGRLLTRSVVAPLRIKQA